MFKMLLLLCLSLCACAEPKDGAPGVNGDAGVPGATGVAGKSPVIEVVTLCPTVPGNYPEILWRLDNGKLYAVYASGANVHLTEVPPGMYISTDGRNCTFTVQADLSIVYP